MLQSVRRARCVDATLRCSTARRRCSSDVRDAVRRRLVSAPAGNMGACCNIRTPASVTQDVLEAELPGLGTASKVASSARSLNPPCGTPGCLLRRCDMADGVYIEFQANCPSRFVARRSRAATAPQIHSTPPCGEWTCSGILYAPSTSGQRDVPRCRFPRSPDSNCDYWDARALASRRWKTCGTTAASSRGATTPTLTRSASVTYLLHS